jgi:hypothetical protein
MTFDDIDTTELARQMTLLDHELYTEIRSSELLRQAWNKAHLKHRSPRVLETIQRFNSVSLWVSGTIVRAETLRERVRVMERFIALATQLRHLQNFNSMMAILSGLNNSAVFRVRLVFVGFLKLTNEIYGVRSSKQQKRHCRNNFSENGPSYRHL